MSGLAGAAVKHGLDDRGGLNGVTAVVLSCGAYERIWPGLTVHVHQSRIANAAEHQAARLDAVAAVRTSHWFWLDDDDDLPPNYLDVIQRCVMSGADVAYTDELVIDENGGGVVRRGATYSQQEHIKNPTLVHHLALYRTDAARAAIKRIPRGHYWPEMQLSFEMAKSSEPAYLPVTGYHWRRGSGGLHAAAHTGMAIVRTQLWCKANP